MLIKRFCNELGYLNKWDIVIQECIDNLIICNIKHYRKSPTLLQRIIRQLNAGKFFKIWFLKS